LDEVAVPLCTIDAADGASDYFFCTPSSTSFTSSSNALHNILSQSKWSSLDQKQAFGWTHPSDPIVMAEEDDGASMVPNDFWLDKKFLCNKFEGNESILTNNEEVIECAKLKS